MTEQGRKAAATAAANKEKRDAKQRLKRELLELMLMTLQNVLQDDSLSSESKLRAVELMDELRKELKL